jgi:hypothetical protein
MNDKHRVTGLKMLVLGMVFVAIFVVLPLCGVFSLGELGWAGALGFFAAVFVPVTGCVLIVGGERVASVVLVADPRHITWKQVAYMCAAFSCALVVGYLLRGSLGYGM